MIALDTVFVLLVITLRTPVASDGAAPWIESLEAPAFEERDLAQRRLAASLVAGDRALVREALARGGAETRLRLADVLGSEDRLFGLAAELAVDAEPHVARAARAGLLVAIERFEPGAREVFLEREDLRLGLEEHVGVPLVLSASLAHAGDASLDVLDLAARAQPDAPEVAVDPAVGAGDLRALTGQPLPWPALVRRVALASGASVVGVGLRREPEPARVRWLALVARDDGVANAADLVARWCAQLASAEDPARRSAAARALAALRWPPVLDWMGERWRTTQDEAALDGLLAAARRGGVPGALAGDAARARLWELVADPAAPAGRVLGAALALAAAGPPAEASGELERALPLLDRTEPRTPWLALVALEGFGGAERAEAAVRAVLRAHPHAALRFQALRAARAQGLAPETLDVLAPEAVFAGAASLGRVEEGARLLSGVPSWPPDAWADPAAVPRGVPPEAFGALAGAWLARGRTDEAGRALEALLERADDGPARARALRDEVGAAALRPAFERAARDAQGDDARAVLAVVCGLARPDEARAALALLSARLPIGARDWECLGLLCAGPQAAPARERLFALLPDAPGALAGAALERAVEALRRGGDDAGARALVAALRNARRADPQGEVFQRLRDGRFPPPWSGRPLALDAWDRDPARAGL